MLKLVARVSTFFAAIFCSLFLRLQQNYFDPTEIILVRQIIFIFVSNKIKDPLAKSFFACSNIM